MKTALAPTVSLATPKVEKFTEKLREFFGRDARILEFVKCEPDISDVEDIHGNKWLEGNWGVKILVSSFSLNYLPDIKNLSASISVDDIHIRAHDEKQFELSAWLTARVMRY